MKTFLELAILKLALKRYEPRDIFISPFSTPLEALYLHTPPSGNELKGILPRIPANFLTQLQNK